MTKNRIAVYPNIVTQGTEIEDKFQLCWHHARRIEDRMEEEPYHEKKLNDVARVTQKNAGRRQCIGEPSREREMAHYGYWQKRPEQRPRRAVEEHQGQRESKPDAQNYNSGQHHLERQDIDRKDDLLHKAAAFEDHGWRAA